MREPTTKSLGKGITQEDKAKSKALKWDHAWHVLETPKEARGAGTGHRTEKMGKGGHRGNRTRLVEWILRTFALRPWRAVAGLCL